MPTSSGRRFTLRSKAGGGAEALPEGSQLPWRAAVGNSVRLVSFARAGRRRSVVRSVRSMGEVAIVASPHEIHAIRLLFARQDKSSPILPPAASAPDAPPLYRRTAPAVEIAAFRASGRAFPGRYTGRVAPQE